MTTFLLVFVPFALLAFSMPTIQIIDIRFNKKARKEEKDDPNYKRPRYFFHRWEVWCAIERGDQVFKEYPVSWWTFKWQAKEEAHFLNSATLVHSMDSLGTDGLMTWADCEVRRLTKASATATLPA